IVWDRGTWELPYEEDARAAVENGQIHVVLHGEKLQGNFVLFRTDKGDTAKEQWLVLHKRDDHAGDGWDPGGNPRSVLSGRTNDEVQADPERVWTREGGGATTPSARHEAPNEDELAELDDLGVKGTWHFQGRELALTNLDKVLFPGRGRARPVTKRELVRYY